MWYRTVPFYWLLLWNKFYLYHLDHNNAIYIYVLIFILVTCLNDCSNFTYKKKIGNEIHLHNKHQTTLYVILDTAVLPHTSVFKYRYANICRMSRLFSFECVEFSTWGFVFDLFDLPTWVCFYSHDILVEPMPNSHSPSVLWAIESPTRVFDAQIKQVQY